MCASIQLISFRFGDQNIIIQSAITLSKWITQSPLLQIRCRFNWTCSRGFVLHRWRRYNGKISISNIISLASKIGAVLFVDVHEKELEIYLNRRLDKEMRRRNMVEFYSTFVKRNGSKLFVSWIGYVQPLSRSKHPFVLDSLTSPRANHYRLSELQLLSFFRTVDVFKWKFTDK